MKRIVLLRRGWFSDLTFRVEHGYLGLAMGFYSNHDSPTGIPSITWQRWVLAISLCLVFASFTLFNPADARPPEKAWDNLCEECHGEYAEFSGKYMWVIEGRLEGQHHKIDLPLFLQNHYIPSHEIEAVSNLLETHANSPLRFDSECGSCHGQLTVFMEKSIWVRGDSMTAMGVGMEVEDYLKSHRDLAETDIEFYMKLFNRMSN